MRTRYEYTFLMAAPSALVAGAPADFELLGRSGWQIAGMCAAGEGTTLVAFQRELGDAELFEEAAASITTEAPLIAPDDVPLDAVGHD